MKTSNQELINRFFEGYVKRDFDLIRKVMPEEVNWSFPGNHPFSGIKKGVDEVIAFFDAMGSVMGKSNPTVTKLVDGSEGDYIIECHHISTNREDGHNIDHYICVLWTFCDDLIVSGKHFFSDPDAASAFFSKTAVEA
ncbi:hypothetical protein GVN16_07470 [Emticicia sp. CRIBPO]|uniref:nuclear transport factor 2 family protein n=1 Tax=Emticicia sp. CRIBPO TaxID=2683258 RepID=UPI00141312F1|nr:nuclear transport factor 2 family protein [Emticicia sp. CRIBPO]NBA85594.1 hypothetical protein [Emticicia sp. CRIBPO]